MEILENIRLKLDNIWKTFDLALKECDSDEGPSCGLLSEEADRASPNRWDLHLHNQSRDKDSDQRYAAGPDLAEERLGGNISTEIPDWITRLLASDQHQLILNPISLPLFPLPRALLTDYIHTKRRTNIKEILRSVLTEDVEDSQTESGEGEEESWSEDDLMKALRKVERKKMSASQACQLYGIPYDKFIEFERLHSKNHRKSRRKIVSSEIKGNPKVLLPFTNIPYDFVKKEIFEEDEVLSRETFPGPGEVEESSGWTGQYLEELEENIWTYRPVKRIKLEKRNISIKHDQKISK